ncbi:hypothetical protein GTV32_09845 [Gordonia sp. SID5947]|uniref:VOC family protein n=1 Tax=Gordonia sp. SID5947 TaxID=2690315 RepID=UPI00136F2F08|nr:VOC family protein [Gordonia sp. SID5947]MYR06594.1 hypothetical protein [Gordonia sp. SID5947]
MTVRLLPISAAATSGIPCWVDLTTRQSERTQAFYQELFGWTFEAGGTIGVLDGEPTCGVLEIPEDARELPAHWFPYFRVNSFDHLAADPPTDGDVIWGPETYGQRLATVAAVVDPHGAGFGLWESMGLSGFAGGRRHAPAWFELSTRHPADIAKFYCQLFDCFPDSISAAGSAAYRVFARPDVLLAGVVASDTEPYWRVYFQVDDLSSSLIHAKALGATQLAERVDLPIGGTALLRDPVGALFGLIEPFREELGPMDTEATSMGATDDNAGYPTTLSL